MNYPIEQDFLSGLPREDYRHISPEGVVAHETAIWNDSVARNKRVFGNGGWERMEAFVHFFVDHKSIWQSALMGYQAWGAGPVANARYVHVELCRRRDHTEFLESYKRYVFTLAYVLRYYKFDLKWKNTFWTHHEVTRTLGGTTHVDPDGYLGHHGITIDQLIRDVRDELNGRSRFEIQEVEGKEDDDMLDKAIVIFDFPDMAVAEVLAARIKAPVYTRAALPEGKIAKEVYVVGGTKDGLSADKFVMLTGPDRFAVARKVEEFLK